MVSTIPAETRLGLRPVHAVRDTLAPESGPGTRIVIAWYVALSEGRFDDAVKMMEPGGPYFLLRQRKIISNAEFGEIMKGLVGTTFTRPIAWSLGPITEQDDRVAVMAAAHVPLLAGGTYENLYHFLFRAGEGRILECYEFGDTLRSAQTFATPPGKG